MKVLCTTSSFNADNFPDDYEIVYNPHKRRLSESEVIELLKQYNPDGLIAGIEPLTRKAINSAVNLKVISRCGVGMDSVDIEAASERNIKVFNTPTVTVKPVAELTVAMIYTLVREITTMDKNTKKGAWAKLQGGLVSEKTIGLIGCGRIGTHVARLLQTTGANFLGYDPQIQNHQYCKMVSFEELITKSDVISLHIPLNDHNKNIISEQVLSSMKKGSILINNSRGGLVDEDALYLHLTNGHLSAAGLDVFETEPYSGPLCKLENALLTPHIGSTAGNSRYEMEAESVRNLVKGLEQQISV
jgi:D-3-phosphoglycerate dehydrogenase / 2-oxoglutarate reductase